MTKTQVIEKCIINLKPFHFLGKIREEFVFLNDFRESRYCNFVFCVFQVAYF